MNRDCHGTYYAAINKYRCLKDGKFCDGPIPERCPLCHRLTAAVTTVPTARLRTIVIEEVELPHGQFVELYRFAGPIREIKDA